MFQSASGDAGRKEELLRRRIAELEAAADARDEQLRRADAKLEESRAALVESEDRFRAILENATDYAIITIDLAGRITGWNAGAARVLGWRETEILWQDAALIWTPEDRDAGVPEAERRAALETGSAAGERWHIRRDGTRFWAQGQLTPLRSGGGLRGYLKILRDHTARHAAEEALGRSEARFRAVAELVPDILWSNTPQGQTCWHNRRWLEHTGQEPEEAQGHGWLDAVHPDDRAAALRNFEAVLGTGHELRQELRIRRGADGSYRWFLARARPVHDAAGAIVQWFGAATDIHEQRTTLEALGRSEVRLTRLLGTTPAAIVEVDADGAFTYANPAAERIVGGSLLGRRLDDPAWQPTTLDGKPFRPEDLLIVRVMQGKAISRCKQLAHMRDGTQRALSANAVPVRETPDSAHPEGRITGGLIVFTDITEQHEAEVALRRLNGTLEAEVTQRTKERDRTWRLSQDLLMVARFDAMLVAINPAWTATLGWTEGELVRRPFLDLIHPDDREATLARMGHLADGLPALCAANRYRHRDGSWRWLAWTAVAEEGLIYATGRDVTAEKEASEALQAAEEQLRQAQKMEAVGQLTGGIAHDFNNLLQGIGGSLEMLELRVGQGRADEAARYVETARKGVDRAAALTQRLLAFARRQQLQPRAVNPDALVRGMEELIQRTVGPEVQVVLRLRDGAWPVLCDANQLENALLNLAINARDAMPGGGTLAISTTHAALREGDVAGQDGAVPGDYVEVAVSDTGTGMTPNVLGRAFEPFFTTKPIGQGTGLGLSQLYGFVRQSSGAVRLESTPGQGTTVRLYLPRHADAGEQGAGKASASQASPMQDEGAMTVLLVEDEQAVRALAAERLREVGYQVLEAGDGPAALHLLRSGIRVDLLVTDVGLSGGLNGRQVADAARDRRPGLPVLFITGYAGDAVDGALPAGMAVIGKPFMLDALAERVRVMLGGGPSGHQGCRARDR